MIAGLECWKENFGQGMEQRGQDGMSWYDLSVNCNSLPCQPDLAIIVTSWAGQLKWLKATLTSYRKTGAFVILAYDNPFYAWAGRAPSQIHKCKPNINHYLLANAVVHKHITYDADKRNGWFWSVRYAQGILKQFPNIKYVYVTNGDCIIEKPEGFRKAIELLGDADITAGQSKENLIHTATMLLKIEAFHHIFDRFAEVMKVPIMSARSPEGVIMEIVEELRIKVKHMPKQPLDKDGTLDCYARYNQDSTWKDILGFRNLFAEYETAGNEGQEMLYLKGLCGRLYGLALLGRRGAKDNMTDTGPQRTEDTSIKFWDTLGR